MAAQPAPAKTAFQQDLEAALSDAHGQAMAAEQLVYANAIARLMTDVAPQLPPLRWSINHPGPMNSGLYGYPAASTESNDSPYEAVRAWAVHFGADRIEVEYRRDTITIDADIEIQGQHCTVGATIWTSEDNTSRPRLRDVRAHANPEAPSPTVSDLIAHYRRISSPNCNPEYFGAEKYELASEINDRIDELDNATQRAWTALLAQRPVAATT